jgi:hypothetical protein
MILTPLVLVFLNNVTETGFLKIVGKMMITIVNLEEKSTVTIKLQIIIAIEIHIGVATVEIEAGSLTVIMRAITIDLPLKFLTKATVGRSLTLVKTKKSVRADLVKVLVGTAEQRNLVMNGHAIVLAEVIVVTSWYSQSTLAVPPLHFNSLNLVAGTEAEVLFNLEERIYLLKELPGMIGTATLASIEIRIL